MANRAQHIPYAGRMDLAMINDVVPADRRLRGLVRARLRGRAVAQRGCNVLFRRSDIEREYRAALGQPVAPRPAPFERPIEALRQLHPDRSPAEIRWMLEEA